MAQRRGPELTEPYAHQPLLARLLHTVLVLKVKATRTFCRGGTGFIAHKLIFVWYSW
jgi:hypothetical protein